ncbi:MAG: hypothetical protein Kow0074_19030 [Candidatus Zixiibacteriota bacterium]
MSSLIGRTISHYTVLERLGAGGMGVVYKAEDTKLNRLVALKFLPPFALDNEEDRIRFTNEAQAAAALDHPNICTIHEISEAEGHHFIAMAYVDGLSLRDRINQGPMPIAEAVDLTSQVAAGLAAAHAQGIIHRDIKPANVVINQNGVAKIVDFGLAKSSISKKLTRTGSTIGTAAYMSPEQARGETVDHRADIWSLGAIFYEMLAGQPPYSGEHEAVVIYSILNEEPRPIRELRPDIPPEIEAIVEKALTRDVDGRYQTAAELWQSLMAVHSGPVSAPTGKIPIYTSQRSDPVTAKSAVTTQKRNPLIYTGIGAAAIVVLMVSWWMFGGTDQPPADDGPRTAVGGGFEALALLDSLDWDDPSGLAENLNGLESLGERISASVAQRIGGLDDTADSGALADSVAVADTLPPRIAVLYLENLSRDRDEDYFAAGMTEDIIIDLMNIAGLRVLSRHDVRPFRGKPLSVKDMGRELDVDYLLEGAVRREKNALRMTITLHDVAGEQAVWAQRFDRPTDDIFRVQSEIADSIATVLRVTISTEEFKKLALPPTNNVEAYDYYLRGREYIEGRSKEDNERAEKLFKRAIDKDKNFALALAGLASVYLQRIDWGFDYDPKWLTESAPLLQAAASANPNSAEIASVFALYYRLRGDLATANQYARRVVELQPNDFEGHYLLGYQLVLAGNWGEAGREFERSLELKPDNPEPYRWKAFIAWSTGDHKWANRHIKRAMELAPDAAHVISWASSLEFFAGDVDAADSLIRRAIRLKPETPSYSGKLGQIQLFGGELDSAIQHLKVAAEETQQNEFYEFLAWAYRLHGDESKAKKAFESMAAQARTRLKITPNDINSDYLLLVARCNLGEIDDPEPELARLAKLAIFPSDEPDVELYRAKVYASMKDVDNTLAALQPVLKRGSYTKAYISSAPQFGFLKDNEEFRALTGRS